MADVRALLAAEKASRRISHPFLTYTKSGQLLCNVCNLNVKSEALWEGHLRSANHRKNAVKLADEKAAKTTLKRKLDDVEESEDEGPPPVEEVRKKPKSRVASRADSLGVVEVDDAKEQDALPIKKTVRFDVEEPLEEDVAEMGLATDPPPAAPPSNYQAEQPETEEDEMAAFEREIADLDQQEQRPDYSAATITAAPVSAAQLQEQQREDKRRQEEVEADDEKEEEGRKLEEEFEVMDELEQKVQKLKARRDALRSGKNVHAEPQAGSFEMTDRTLPEAPPASAPTQQDDESSDDDDVDDWYG